jgi:hypothetical protein
MNPFLFSEAYSTSHNYFQLFWVRLLTEMDNNHVISLKIKPVRVRSTLFVSEKGFCCHFPPSSGHIKSPNRHLPREGPPECAGNRDISVIGNSSRVNHFKTILVKNKQSKWKIRALIFTNRTTTLVDADTFSLRNNNRPRRRRRRQLLPPLHRNQLLSPPRHRLPRRK